MQNPVVEEIFEDMNEVLERAVKMILIKERLCYTSLIHVISRYECTVLLVYVQ